MQGTKITSCRGVAGQLHALDHTFAKGSASCHSACGSGTSSCHCSKCFFAPLLLQGSTQGCCPSCLPLCYATDLLLFDTEVQ